MFAPSASNMKTRVKRLKVVLKQIVWEVVQKGTGRSYSFLCFSKFVFGGEKALPSLYVEEGVVNSHSS